MIKASKYNSHILQILCSIWLLCTILLDIPAYLKFYIFPITSLSFMFYLAILRINKIHEKAVDQYNLLITNHANNEAWLNEELYQLTKKRNYIAFNKIHRTKYDILRAFLDNRSSIVNVPPSVQTNTQPQETTPPVSLKESVDHYNEELYNRVWSFLDDYITQTLTPFFTKEDINIIKHCTYEFFINDRRTICTEHKVIIPTYLSMQDIAHFFHNISELMSYYKKLKQVDFFKYIPGFMVLGDYDPQSLYRNSTRISGSSLIQLCRISDQNNVISNFVKQIKEELPYNQRIIS